MSVYNLIIYYICILYENIKNIQSEHSLDSNCYAELSNANIKSSSGWKHWSNIINDIPESEIIFTMYNKSHLVFGVVKFQLVPHFPELIR